MPLMPQNSENISFQILQNQNQNFKVNERNEIVRIIFTGIELSLAPHVIPANSVKRFKHINRINHISKHN